MVKADFYDAPDTQDYDDAKKVVDAYQRRNTPQKNIAETDESAEDKSGGEEVNSDESAEDDDNNISEEQLREQKRKLEEQKRKLDEMEAIPMAKKLWRNLSPDMKDAVYFPGMKDGGSHRIIPLLALHT